MRLLIAVWMSGVLRLADRMPVRLSRQDRSPAAALKAVAA